MSRLQLLNVTSPIIETTPQLKPKLRPISEYIPSLMADPPNALAPLTQRFTQENIEKNKALLLEKDYWVSILSYFETLLQAYQAALQADNVEKTVEKKLIDASLDVLAGINFNNMRGFRQKTKYQLLTHHFSKWLQLKSHHGNVHDALLITLTMYYLASLAVVYFYHAPFWLKHLIPDSVKETICNLKSEIESCYPCLIQEFRSQVVFQHQANIGEKNDLITQLRASINESTTAIKSAFAKMRMLASATEKKLTLLNQAMVLMDGADKSATQLWQGLTDPKDIELLLALLKLTPQEQQHWQRKFANSNKRIRRITLRKHQCSLTRVVVCSMLERAYQTLAEGYLDDEETVIEQTPPLKERLAEAIEADKALYTDEKAALFESELMTALDNLPQVMPINPDNYSRYYDTFVRRLNEQPLPITKIIVHHYQSSLEELTKYAHAFAVQKQEMAQWLQSVIQFSTTIQAYQHYGIPLEAPELLLNSLITHMIQQLAPTDVTATLSSQQEKLDFIATYHDNVLATIKQKKIMLEQLATDADHMTLRRTLTQFKQYLERTLHHSIWDLILRWLSPAYERCMNQCMQIVKQHDFNRDEDLIPCCQALRKVFTQEQRGQPWWDLTRSHIRYLGGWFDNHLFFHPLPPVDVEEEAREFIDELAPSNLM